MLGALAWQATTVIKMILCLRGEIARGLFYLSPGFSPLCLVSPVSALHNRSIIVAQRSTVGNRSWSYHQTSKPAQLYHGIFCSCMKKYTHLSAVWPVLWWLNQLVQAPARIFGLGVVAVSVWAYHALQNRVHAC